MKDYKISVTLSPNDYKRFLNLATAKHAGESDKLACSNYANDVVQQSLQHEPLVRELAIRAAMRYPHFEKGEGLQVLNRVRRFLGMTEAMEYDF